MKVLTLKIVALAVFVSGFCFLIGYLADGYTDPYYIRFTTAKQQSLILGNSKAAQDLVPSVLDSILKKSHKGIRTFNFAFSLGHSPYGPTYYRAVCQKLDERTRNGLYIVTVDPWSIASKKGSPNDSLEFVERKLCLGQVHNFNSKPNFEYLLKSYQGTLGNILFTKFKKQKGSGYVHKDGWLEVFSKWDSLEAKENTLIKLRDYKDSYLPNSEFSLLRLSYLEKTIQMLKGHGEVLIVRLPIDAEIKNIDNILMPDFDRRMMDLANRNSIKYLNLIDSKANYRFNDGVHMNRKSCKEFSRDLALMIQNVK